MSRLKLEGMIPAALALCVLFAPAAHSQEHQHESPSHPSSSAAPMGDMMMRMQMHMMADSVIHQRMMSDSTMHSMMMEMMSAMSPEDRQRMMEGMHAGGTSHGAESPAKHEDE